MAQLPSQQLALKLRDLQAPMRAGGAKPGPIPGSTPPPVAPPSVAGGPSGRPPEAPAVGYLLNQAPTQTPATTGAPGLAPTPAAPPQQPGSEGSISKVEFARDTLTDKAKAGAVTAESEAKLAQDQAVFAQEQARVADAQRQQTALADFGAIPSFASLPGAPAPPVRPDGSNFNPMTGQWSGKRPESADRQMTDRPVDTARPADARQIPPGLPDTPPAPADPNGKFVISSGASGQERIPIALSDILRRRAAAMSIHGGKGGPQV